MTDVRRLLKEHSELDRFAARLEAFARQTSSRASDAISVKMQLSVDLAAHLASEDEGLYAPLRASGDLAAVGSADRMRCELDALKDDWAAYLTEWSDDAVEQDWDDFAAETLEMMARLRARIACENAYLIPFALQRGYLPFKAAA